MILVHLAKTHLLMAVFVSPVYETVRVCIVLILTRYCGVIRFNLFAGV
jgi:hypothetical protein